MILSIKRRTLAISLAASGTGIALVSTGVDAVNLIALLSYLSGFFIGIAYTMKTNGPPFKLICARNPCKHCGGTGEPRGYDNAEWRQGKAVCCYCMGKG